MFLFKPRPVGFLQNKNSCSLTPYDEKDFLSPQYLMIGEYS